MGDVGFSMRPQHRGILITSDDLDDLLARHGGARAAFVTIFAMRREQL